MSKVKPPDTQAMWPCARSGRWRDSASRSEPQCDDSWTVGNAEVIGKSFGASASRSRNGLGGDHWRSPRSRLLAPSTLPDSRHSELIRTPACGNRYRDSTFPGDSTCCMAGDLAWGARDRHSVLHLM